PTSRPPRSTLVPYTTLFRSADDRCRPDTAGLAFGLHRRRRAERERAVRGAHRPLATEDLPWLCVLLQARGDVHRIAGDEEVAGADRKSTRLNSSHQIISYAV